MTLTQTPRPRHHACPLHVEPLENRCLLTGKHAWLATTLALVPDPALPALVAAPVSRSLATDNQVVSTGASDSLTDNLPDGSGAQATSGDGSSGDVNDPGLLQGDPGQGNSDGSAGTSGDTSSTGDAGAGQSQASAGTLGVDQTQAFQDAVGIDNTTLGQAAGATSIQEAVVSSLTIVAGNQQNQQGDNSGSGTGGDNSGSGGDNSGATTGDQSGSGSPGDQTGSGATTQDSSTTPTGDQGTGANTNTSSSNASNNNSTVLTGPMGPNPAPPSAGHSGGGNAAGAGNNPPANPGDSRPATVPDPAASAPKLPEDSTQRLPPTLAQADGPKYTQKILAGLGALSGHADSIRPADARDAGETGAEKRTEGVKGNFTVEESPPPAVETEGAVVRAEDRSPASETLVTEPVESPAPVRAVPPPGSILLAAAMPFDLPALEKGVHGFFAQLEQVSEQIVSAQDRTGVGPWLAALATAGIALEIARRRLKPTPGSSEGADGDPEPTWNWLVTPVDALAPDPG